MKKFIILILAAFIFTLNAEDNEHISKIAVLNLNVDNINQTDETVNDLIQKFDLKIDNMNNNSRTKSSSYILLTRGGLFEEVLEELTALGDTDLRQIETINNYFNLRSNSHDLEYLESQKTAYMDELAKPHIQENSEYYYDLWESEREFDEKIYQSNLARFNLLNEIEYFRIELEISENTAQDLNERDEFFDFVNMPGFESNLFILENPDDSISAGGYIGGSLRYMFTRGKTFFTIGILKPWIDFDENISTQANDILIYGLGKDFYPRYLGQGRRTWFNPYSGFFLGGMILTSEDDINHIFTSEFHLRIEIFKNRYVILDTRIGYTIPLDEDRIKIMRGFTQNLTFNIVF